MFTLPVCLRSPTNPGWPPSDTDVCQYFQSLSRLNDCSITSLVDIVCFIAGAHKTMNNWLLALKQEQGSPDASLLLSRWHQIMESSEQSKTRVQFFKEVVAESKQVSLSPLAMIFWLETLIVLQLKAQIPQNTLKSGSFHPQNSPKRDLTTNAVPEGHDPTIMARTLYNAVAQNETKTLMTTLSSLVPPQKLCVMYFDEAHELGLCFWTLLRLLHNQAASRGMWYVFMGTKSSLSYYAPRPADR